jgi:hypothetical protein
MRGRPEAAVAVVNGLLVVLIPLALLVVGSYLDLFVSDTDTSVTVRPPGAPRLPDVTALAPYAVYLVWLLALATLAGWRSWVHAKHWREDKSGGWGGVLEAGLTGFAIALVVLGPGVVTRPMAAPPYVIVYGGAALIVGLLVGLALRTVGVLVLRLHRSGAA